ncbi:hypothetical protein ACFP2T_41100 [Plantactinospora solaniradicis]|uniref:Aspartate carbamoyltransferase n=1 Tax=Plantactinospora solaniradicis TaxID=1723736 RepID=A0ABW1KN52_9ACTN
MTSDAQSRRPSPGRGTVLAVVAAALVVVALVVLLDFRRAGEAPPADAGRQADVAERGREVMPFDLERSTHRFSKTGTGGRQTVTVDEPVDQRQVGLVREHLRAEAERFRRGDFADPARIHGAEMPGLAELRAGAARIRIDYRELPDGAQLDYLTAEPALLSALHAWFDAQVSDHGRHAEHGEPTTPVG